MDAGGSYMRLKDQPIPVGQGDHHGTDLAAAIRGTPEFHGTPRARRRRDPGQPATRHRTDLTQHSVYARDPGAAREDTRAPKAGGARQAQRLLVLKQDKSVIRRCRPWCGRPTTPRGFHALWTLKVSGRSISRCTGSRWRSQPRMRCRRCAPSETLYKHGDKSLADNYRAASRDADPDGAAGHPHDQL